MSRKKYINLNFSEIIFRIKKYKNIKNDLEVANLLGLSKTAISERKRRNSVPIDKITLFCERESINVDWLLAGEGKMEKIPPIIAEPQAPHTTQSKVTKLIVQMLEDMPEEAQRDVLRYLEEKKLLKDLLKEKRTMKKGG